MMADSMILCISELKENKENEKRRVICTSWTCLSL